MIRKSILSAPLILIVFCASFCVTANEATQWNEANNFFRTDPNWRGSDDAYSIKLDNGKILWLFGDTIISDKNEFIPRAPSHCRIIRNSIGIQEGSNPLTASMKYYWNQNNNLDKPEAFFQCPAIDKDNWLWPGDGALLPDGKTLVLFMMNINPAENSLHFDIEGYQVAIIRNIDKTPDKWDIQYVKKLSSYKKLKVLIGSGGVICEGDFL